MFNKLGYRSIGNWIMEQMVDNSDLTEEVLYSEPSMHNWSRGQRAPPDTSPTLDLEARQLSPESRPRKTYSTATSPLLSQTSTPTRDRSPRRDPNSSSVGPVSSTSGSSPKSPPVPPNQQPSSPKNHQTMSKSTQSLRTHPGPGRKKQESTRELGDKETYEDEETGEHDPSNNGPGRGRHGREK